MSKLTASLEDWIQSFPEGKKWFDSIQSEDTKRIYLSRLNFYCSQVKKNPSELITLKVEGLKAVATPTEFCAEDLLESLLYKADSDLTDSAKIAVKTTVMSFYAANRRHLSPDTASKITPPEPKQRSPKMEDLQTLDECMTTQRDKFLVWFLASAPFRVGTVRKLKWRDLEPTGDPEVPYRIVIESTRLKGQGKGKYHRIKQVGFLHSLAAKKLEKYKTELKEKEIEINPDMALFVAYKNYIEKGENLVSFNAIFNDASLIAWKDLEKKRFSPHDVRDFTQSALESSGLNTNLVSPFLGHKVKSVDFHYSSHDIEELMGKFKIALPFLLPQSVEKLKAETDKAKAEYEAKYQIQQKLLKEQDVKIDELETKFEAKLAETMKKAIDFINQQQQNQS